MALLTLLDAILPPVPKIRPRPPFLSQEEGSLSTRDPVKRIRTVGPLDYTTVVKHRETTPWQEKREAEHQRGLCKWSKLFEEWDASLDSRILEMHWLANQEERVGVIADFVSRKAPATILKRANSLLRLTAMAKARGLGFPLPEHEVYSILNDAKLRLLARVIDAVARELFFPDASRAGRFAGYPPEDLLEHRDFSEPSHAQDCQDPESSYWDESSHSWSWVPFKAGPKASKLKQISTPRP